MICSRRNSRVRNELCKTTVREPPENAVLVADHCEELLLVLRLLQMRRLRAASCRWGSPPQVDNAKSMGTISQCQPKIEARFENLNLVRP